MDHKIYTRSIQTRRWTDSPETTNARPQLRRTVGQRRLRFPALACRETGGSFFAGLPSDRPSHGASTTRRRGLPGAGNASPRRREGSLTNAKPVIRQVASPGRRARGLCRFYLLVSDFVDDRGGLSCDARHRSSHTGRGRSRRRQGRKKCWPRAARHGNNRSASGGVRRRHALPSGEDGRRSHRRRGAGRTSAFVRRRSATERADFVPISHRHVSGGGFPATDADLGGIGSRWVVPALGRRPPTEGEAACCG